MDDCDGHDHLVLPSVWEPMGQGTSLSLHPTEFKTESVIQIHPAHNFTNIDYLNIILQQDERPTLLLSFSVFYEGKYEVLHPVKIE